jgi:hypothetical protein
MLDRPPKPPADKAARRRLRQKRHRLRQRQHEAVAPVCYGGRVLNALIRNHWLDERDCADRQLVGDAISRMLRASFEDCG